MSQLPLAKTALSPEEYLAGEPLADVRHEYVGGHVYAMAGANRRHNQLVHNLEVALGVHLTAGPCTVASGDLLVRAAEDIFYYPDVVVSCDPTDTHELYVERPRLIAEVMSTSTRRIDETQKAADYLALPSLESYLLVAQDELLVTAYRRAGERWELDTLTRLDDLLVVPSLSFSLPLATLYRRTPLVPGGAD